MKEITLTVSVDEANLILEGLGNMPFAKVYALVGRIQQQASRQLESATPAADQPGGEPPPRLQQE
jgi:hypothetical protein